MGPPPWSAELTPNCFIVRDAHGQQLNSIMRVSRAAGRRLARGLAARLSLQRPDAPTPDRHLKLESDQLPSPLLMPVHKSLHLLKGNGAIVVGIHGLEDALLSRLPFL